MAADELSLRDPYTVPTRYWHRLTDGRIQCDVRPRACKLWPSPPEGRWCGRKRGGQRWRCVRWASLR